MIKVKRDRKFRSSPLENLINKIIWHPELNPGDYEIVYLHRGAENNKKTIPMDKISIEDSFIIYEESHIPLHRILEIKNLKTGKTIYDKPPGLNKNR